MGAEIRGIDLSKVLEERTQSAIHQALLDHLVLLFRDQELIPADHTRLAERYGELFVHPYLHAIEGHPYIHEIRKEADTTPNFGGVWHTDGTFLECPVKIITLYAKEIPAYGGDTLFINQYLAYEALSPAMKRVFDQCRIVHMVTDTYADVVKITPGSTATPVARISTSHPAVRTHPETGKRCMYLGGHFAKAIDGMTAEESRPLLDFIHRHAERPEFQFRQSWRKNDFLIWDNRCTMHYALNDYAGQPRVMHRAFMMEATRPV